MKRFEPVWTSQADIQARHKNYQPGATFMHVSGGLAVAVARATLYGKEEQACVFVMLGKEAGQYVLPASEFHGDVLVQEDNGQRLPNTPLFALSQVMENGAIEVPCEHEWLSIVELHPDGSYSTPFERDVCIKCQKMREHVKGTRAPCPQEWASHSLMDHRHVCVMDAHHEGNHLCSCGARASFSKGHWARPAVG